MLRLGAGVTGWSEHAASDIFCAALTHDDTAFPLRLRCLHASNPGSLTPSTLFILICCSVMRTFMADLAAIAVFPLNFSKISDMESC